MQSKNVLQTDALVQYNFIFSYKISIIVIIPPAAQPIAKCLSEYIFILFDKMTIELKYFLFNNNKGMIWAKATFFRMRKI